MTRLMYDSTEPAQIPKTADMVFHPINGSFTWPKDILAQWGEHQQVGYDALGRTDSWFKASFVDWEPGMVQDPGFLLMFVRKRNQYRPGTAGVYTTRSQLQQVTRILKGEIWHLGLADPTGTEHAAIPDTMSGPFTNLVFTQYRWPPKGTTTQFYDISLVSDDKWHPSA